jgi:hypothetical protein
VAYKAAGTKHNILLSDSLLGQIYKNLHSLELPDSSQLAILRNTFNLPKVMESHYLEIQNEINQVVETELYKGVAEEGLIKASLRILTESLPDFVTFNSSIVDQMQWERVSNVELTDGTSEAECDLFTLLNEFCCNAILPPIVGAQFTESYQLLATDLASCNERFWALALGLPRLTPVQGLPGAALARKRLLKNFANLFTELTHPPVRRVPDDDESVSGEEDTDADVVTPLMKLNESYKSQLTILIASGFIKTDNQKFRSYALNYTHNVTLKHSHSPKLHNGQQEQARRSPSNSFRCHRAAESKRRSSRDPRHR